jgi:hypothetical protein
MIHTLSIMPMHTRPYTHTHIIGRRPGPDRRAPASLPEMKVKVPYTETPLCLVLWIAYTKKNLDSFPLTGTGVKKTFRLTEKILESFLGEGTGDNVRDANLFTHDQRLMGDRRRDIRVGCD